MGFSDFSDARSSHHSSSLNHRGQKKEACTRGAAFFASRLRFLSLQGALVSNSFGASERKEETHHVMYVAQA